MSMETIERYRCDTEGCENKMEAHMFDALDLLLKAGWIIGCTIGNDDYCPKCAAERGEEK